MELSNLTLAELVALHNEHADRPVKKFRDKATAVARVQAVLPEAAPLASSEADDLGDLLTEPTTIDALAAELGTSERAARSFIDRMRRQGVGIKNCAPRTFVRA